MNLPTYPNSTMDSLPWPRDIHWGHWFYRLSRMACILTCNTLWTCRVYNRHLEPDHGGVVYFSNHQSFLDPVLVGYALRRPCNFMARDSLFHNPVFGRLIRTVYAFPVRRGSADTGAIKEAMRRLKNDQAMVIFPEGTRTPDGKIKSMLPGVSLLSQRAAMWTVPVVVDGAYEAWPRHAPLPTPFRRLNVMYGPPVHRDEIRTLSPDDFVSGMRARLIEMQHELRRRTGKQPFVYDE
jgi:1-acyl-sn-glycerol-3-phosphate acyltransferase